MTYKNYENLRKMKNLTNKIILLTIASIMYSFLSCETQTNQTNKKNGTDNLFFISDSVCIDKIRKLNFLERQERKTGNLEYIVRDMPTQEKPYYIIQVGKSNNYRFEVFYNFYCYPKSGKIKFYDTIRDTLIDVPVGSDL